MRIHVHKHTQYTAHTYAVQPTAYTYTHKHTQHTYTHTRTHAHTHAHTHTHIHTLTHSMPIFNYPNFPIESEIERVNKQHIDRML